MFTDNVYPKPFFVYENDVLTKHDSHLKLSPIEKLTFLLSQKSILFNKLLDFLKVNKTQYKQNFIENNLAREIDYNLTFRLIKEMNDIATKNKIKFIVLIYPSKNWFYENSEISKRFLDSSLLKNITIINMYDYFSKKGFTTENFIDFSIDKILHLNAKGHKLTADVIYDVLSNLNFINH